MFLNFRLSTASNDSARHVTPFVTAKTNSAASDRSAPMNEAFSGGELSLKIRDDMACHDCGSKDDKLLTYRTSGQKVCKKCYTFRHSHNGRPRPPGAQCQNASCETPNERLFFSSIGDTVYCQRCHHSRAKPGKRGVPATPPASFSGSYYSPGFLSNKAVAFNCTRDTRSRAVSPGSSSPLMSFTEAGIPTPESRTSSYGSSSATGQYLIRIWELEATIEGLEEEKKQFLSAETTRIKQECPENGYTLLNRENHSLRLQIQDYHHHQGRTELQIGNLKAEMETLKAQADADRQMRDELANELTPAKEDLATMATKLAETEEAVSGQKRVGKHLYKENVILKKRRERIEKLSWQLWNEANSDSEPEYPALDAEIDKLPLFKE